MGESEWNPNFKKKSTKMIYSIRLKNKQTFYIWKNACQSVSQFETEHKLVLNSQTLTELECVGNFQGLGQ